MASVNYLNDDHFMKKIINCNKKTNKNKKKKNSVKGVTPSNWIVYIIDSVIISWDHSYINLLMKCSKITTTKIIDQLWKKKKKKSNNSVDVITYDIKCN